MKELLLIAIILLTLLSLSLGIKFKTHLLASTETIDHISELCKKSIIENTSEALVEEYLITCINQKLDIFDYQEITELPIKIKK